MSNTSTTNQILRSRNFIYQHNISRNICKRFMVVWTCCNQIGTVFSLMLSICLVLNVVYTIWPFFKEKFIIFYLISDIWQYDRPDIRPIMWSLCLVRTGTVLCTGAGWTCSSTSPTTSSPYHPQAYDIDYSRLR